MFCGKQYSVPPTSHSRAAYEVIVLSEDFSRPTNTASSSMSSPWNRQISFDVELLLIEVDRNFKSIKLLYYRQTGESWQKNSYRQFHSTHDSFNILNNGNRAVKLVGWYFWSADRFGTVLRLDLPLTYRYTRLTKTKKRTGN